MAVKTLAVTCDACTRGYVRAPGNDWARTCTICGGRGSVTYVRVGEIAQVPTRIIRRIAHGQGVRAETAARVCARLASVVHGPPPSPLFPGRTRPS